MPSAAPISDTVLRDLVNKAMSDVLITMLALNSKLVWVSDDHPGDDPPPLADLIPTGFGKVEIESLAKFEFNGLSPTYVPGRQFLTVLVELFSSAAIGSTAFSQKLNKRWIQSAAPISRNLRYDEIATNLLLSTFTVADLADVTPEDLASTNVSDIQQRPARVDIAP